MPLMHDGAPHAPHVPFTFWRGRFVNGLDPDDWQEGRERRRERPSPQRLPESKTLAWHLTSIRKRIGSKRPANRGRRVGAEPNVVEATAKRVRQSPGRPRRTYRDQWLLPKEVAAMLRVGESTVYEWIKAGHLPATRIGRGQRRPGYRISEADLDAWLDERTSGRLDDDHEGHHDGNGSDTRFGGAR